MLKCRYDFNTLSVEYSFTYIYEHYKDYANVIMLGLKKDSSQTFREAVTNSEDCEQRLVCHKLPNSEPT